MELIDLIGKSPLIKLKHLVANPNVGIYAKMEGQNPGGSVKDRPAYYMIKKSIDRGDLKKGDTIIEATSGNTGIALAMIAASFKIPIKLLMPENATPERVKVMKAYGAEVILTPQEGTIEYSRRRAQELSDKHGYVLLDQFNNYDNVLSHIETTGPEIWEETCGKITHFVSSMGTTGTITGCATFFKNQNPRIQVIGAQPTENSQIPGIRKWSQEMMPGIYDANLVDQIRYVSTSEATSGARKLAQSEGIFAGMSSGGAWHIANHLAKELDHGLIVFVVCDRGDRYLSSDMYI